MATPGIFSKTGQNAALFATFVVGSAALIAGNKAYNMAAYCGNGVMSAGKWTGNTFMDGVHFTLKDGGITGPTSAGILAGTAIGLTYKYGAIAASHQFPIKSPGHNVFLSEIYDLQVGNRSIVMATSVFALTLLAVRYSNSKFSSHQMSLAGALAYASIATIASLFAVGNLSDDKHGDYEANKFANYPERLVELLSTAFTSDASRFWAGKRSEQPAAEYISPSIAYRRLSSEDAHGRLQDWLPLHAHTRAFRSMHAHTRAFTWNESAKMGIYAGLASGVATAVAYLGVKSIFAFGEAFPMINGSIPAAVIVAPTFVLARGELSKEKYNLRRKQQELYSMAIAAILGTALTPTLSSYMLKKKVGYLASAGYSLAPIVAMFLMKHTGAYTAISADTSSRRQLRPVLAFFL